MKSGIFRQLFAFRSILQKNSAENEKSKAELLFLILSAMFWYASHLCSLKNWLSYVLFNKPILELRKTLSKFWLSEQVNSYNTCTPPILWVLPCSQAHNLLTCDQPDHKDNFSPIKKNTKVLPILMQRPP